MYKDFLICRATHTFDSNNDSFEEIDSCFQSADFLLLYTDAFIGITSE